MNLFLEFAWDLRGLPVRAHQRHLHQSNLPSTAKKIAKMIGIEQKKDGPMPWSSLPSK